MVAVVLAELSTLVTTTPAVTRQRRRNCQQQALGQHLAEQPQPACAQRGTNGHSFCRAAARASNKLATFAQAISRIKPTRLTTPAAGAAYLRR